ncbi:MAG: DUF507 family protein [Candidatus Moduliflexus flocculans]|nr:DUF507 family protein [Candidatus Moduliflexus flocculans]
MEKIRTREHRVPADVQRGQEKAGPGKGDRAVSSRLSREKINYLSRQVLTVLEKDEQVDFLDDPNEIRLVIVKSIEEEMMLYESLDKKAIDKIQSQKKAIEEGSREWEILYRKYYNDELAKLGKLSD